jgi:serine/threonine protein kinase
VPLQPGSRIGRYEVVSAIGAGGMGEVYRARDTRLDRTVAIKILTGALSEDMESRSRFEQEARAIAALNDPHICALYDISLHGDLDYLVLEYLEGETLADQLKRSPVVPTAEALAIAIQIGDALDRAHRAGIAHRDLKPGNVMLAPSGVDRAVGQNRQAPRLRPRRKNVDCPPAGDTRRDVRGDDGAGRRFGSSADCDHAGRDVRNRRNRSIHGA